MSKASLELGGGNWAAKDGKLLGYAVGDTSGKYLPREFTFSRGADIAATRVNKDGLIEKYRENLLLRSNQFDTSWTSNNTTETGGQAGYDGTSDGWLLAKTASDGETRQSVDAGLRTFSIYAKAGSLSWVYLLKGGNAGQYFNLGTGLLGSPTGVGGNVPLDAKIENVGGGWYRCSMTYNDLYAGSLRIYPADGDNDTSGTTGNIYIQDAQLEYGLVATDYLESDSTTGKAGVLDNLPRIDYTSGIAQLLMEPSRTNSIPYSEYAGSYTTSGTGTVTDNHSTSPEGVLNAFQLNDTGTSAYFRIEDNVTVSAGNVGDHTLSVFIKKTTGSLSHYAGVQLDSARQYVIVDTTNGTANEVTGTANDSFSVEDFSDDYWRVSITNNLASAADYRVALWPAISENGTTISTAATGSNIFYGIQLEKGSYATSYIPNYGTALGMTRAAEGEDKDSFVTELPSELSGGYTLFMDFEVTGNEDPATNYEDLFDFRFDDAVNKSAFRVETFNSGTPNYVDSIRGFAYKQSSGSAVASVNAGDIPFGSRVKLAVTFDDSYGVKMFYNGSKIKDYAEVTSYEKVKFIGGAGSDGNTRSRTLVNQILAYPTVLSETECENLTTI